MKISIMKLDLRNLNQINKLCPKVLRVSVKNQLELDIFERIFLFIQNSQIEN